MDWKNFTVRIRGINMPSSDQIPLLEKNLLITIKFNLFLTCACEYNSKKFIIIYRTLCGTPNYIAPEILCKLGHSYEVDIWSIGCIL